MCGSGTTIDVAKELNRKVSCIVAYWRPMAQKKIYTNWFFYFTKGLKSIL